MKKISNPKELKKILVIEKKDKGVTIWIKDGKIKYWILDASMLAEDGEIRISKRNTYKYFLKQSKDSKFDANYTFQIIKNQITT